MLIKPRVYLDTTVPSALLDARAPLRQEATRIFWEAAAQKYRLFISDLTLNEIARTPNLEHRAQLMSLTEHLEVLETTSEADILAEQYVLEGIIPSRFVEDCTHLAIATAHAVGIVASWNFRHMVKVATRNRVNAVNAMSGYGALDIVTPEQL